MRKCLWPLILCLSLYLMLSAAAAVFLANVTLHPQRRSLPATAEAGMRDVVGKFGARLTNVDLNAFDHAQLRAWYIEQNQGNGDVVILLHGQGDNRLGMVGYAQILVAHGYSVLMPDARAHGESGGDFATYGVLERVDIRQWFDWLKGNTHSGCVFGMGESMGAAQLLQALEVEPDFCTVIAESSFSDFREIAYDRMGQYFHAGPWLGRTMLRPVIEMALAYVRVMHHLDLAAASPSRAVAHTSIPVMLIHGETDGNIPVYHSRWIKAQNSNVELWEVPSADHCGAITVAPQELEHKIVRWFETHGPELRTRASCLCRKSTSGHGQGHGAFTYPTVAGAGSSTLAARRNFAASSGGVGLM